MFKSKISHIFVGLTSWNWSVKPVIFKAVIWAKANEHENMGPKKPLANLLGGFLMLSLMRFKAYATRCFGISQGYYGPVK